MATPTFGTGINLSTETMTLTAATTLATMAISTMVPAIRHHVEPSATISFSLPSPEATPTPKPYVQEPLASATSFWASVANIIYLFVYTFPKGFVGIIVIINFLMWAKRRRQRAAAKAAKLWEEREKAETRTTQFLLLQEATATRECMERIEAKISAGGGGMDEGVREVMLAMVEATKEGRNDDRRRRRKKETTKEMKQGLQKIEVKLDDFFDLIPTNKAEIHKNMKRKRRHQAPQALLPDVPGMDNNNEPACGWGGSTTSTESESLGDAGGLAERQPDEHYEADKEESAWSEGDSHSTVSNSFSSPDTPWDWDQAEKQALLDGYTWNWEPSGDANTAW
ncbi:hypothetical protein QBC45DRAFT_339556 [Copromyces sp. CBS 386.78]|nr:hypothetical protein QBC45DRAFT_339556 [Copromyces sp. CBS 386.78]